MTRRPGAEIPDVVTHYHLAGRPPFLNLSDLPDDKLAEVLRTLERERSEGTSARVFGRRYMELRRRTEEKLRALFIDVGGRPERRAPHYFVLGSSPWYRGLAAEMGEVVLPLAALPSEVSSVTASDSVTAMGFGGDYGLPLVRRASHGRVFRLEELADVIDTFGLPSSGPGGYDGYQNRPFEKYIEIQLWSDGPLTSLMA
ncbi:MAG TPA: hypothetical protein VN796_01310 [Acidimicrobiales bacterium]|nr:hypothetical protein [Acidimicrobiales bacterium]